MSKRSRRDVIVVGAGIIGLSTALMLQMRGLSVTILDREGPAAGASAGNAGAFVFTDILPLASPGILRKAPRWLIDPLGPLSIPPSYALPITPWMFRFWRACSPENVANSTQAQASLMALSKAELEPFLKATGTIDMLRRDGNLQLYESELEFQASIPGWNVRSAQGIAFHHMNKGEMASVQPGLSPRLVWGTFTPGCFSIADPMLFTIALADRFCARGGVIQQTEVNALRISGGDVEVCCSTSSYYATHAVIAAGAFSHQIAGTIGEKIPLETERGYNTTLSPSAFDLRMQLTFGGHGFVISSLSTGIRVGGAVELGGLCLPPNFRRADAMLRKAKAFLPGLETSGGVQWMGFRPSLPDSLPAIGRSRASANIIYAFGHGHLGLTQSTGTARLVSDLVTGKNTALDLSPFSPQRF